MDRWIRTAWRAFWVGLGASAVLISQSVVAPGHAASPAQPAAPMVAPVAPPADAVRGVHRVHRVQPESADPILSRNPFDSKTGPLVPRG